MHIDNRRIVDVREVGQDRATVDWIVVLPHQPFKQLGYLALLRHFLPSRILIPTDYRPQVKQQYQHRHRVFLERPVIFPPQPDALNLANSSCPECGLQRIHAQTGHQSPDRKFSHFQHLHGGNFSSSAIKKPLILHQPPPIHLIFCPIVDCIGGKQQYETSTERRKKTQNELFKNKFHFCLNFRINYIKITNC